MDNSIIYIRKSNFSTALLLMVSIVLSAYSGIEIVNRPSGHAGWYLSIVFCSIVWITLYLFSAWRTFKHIYLFSTAYLTALILFHLSLFYQFALGDIKLPSSWEHGSFSPWLENSGWHILLALSSFGIGFSCAALTGKKYLKNIDPQLIMRAKAAGHWSAIGLLIASSIFFSMALYSYGNLLNYARDEIFSSNLDSRGFGVFMMIFPGSILLYFFSETTKKQFLIGLGLAFFAFLMFMFAGYRSAALFPSLVGVALWVKSGRKLPLPVVISGVVLVLTLIAASGYLRSMGKYSEINMNKVSKAMGEASIQSSISEMGSSVKALANVIRLVPKIDGYRYGSSYFYSVVDSFPNMGGDINIERSRKYAMKQKGKDPDVIKNMRPADWLTYRIAPWHFKHGFGVGFSAIAEPFLNFGTAGVFCFFIALGFGLCRLDSVPLFYSPYLFIFSTSMLWPLIRTVRNDSSNFFKPFMFTIIILLVWWTFSKIILNKKI